MENRHLFTDSGRKFAVGFPLAAVSAILGAVLYVELGYWGLLMLICLVALSAFIFSRIKN